MKRYSDSEVGSPAELDALIEDLTAAAKDAIEKAAAEAAKAAVLAGIEREAVLLREVKNHQTDAVYWREQAEFNLKAVEEAKKTGKKNVFIAGAVCLLGGLFLGAGGALILGR